nr:MAG TPA: hypothetical protein [Caudoviricetes sp.]
MLKTVREYGVRVRLCVVVLSRFSFCAYCKPF